MGSSRTVVGPRPPRGRMFLLLPARNLILSRGFPDFDGAISAAGDDPLSIGGEGGGKHHTGMSSEGKQFLTGRTIPELRRMIRATCENPRVVRGKNGRMNMRGMPTKRHLLFASGRVPDGCAQAVAARHDPTVIVREGGRPDRPALLVFEREPFHAAFHIPNPGHSV